MMTKKDILLSIAAIAFVIISESIPFLYNDAYTVKDMKWGWIVSIPILIIAKNFFDKRKKKSSSQ